jgi:hypothetical protein
MEAGKLASLSNDSGMKPNSFCAGSISWPYREDFADEPEISDKVANMRTVGSLEI